MGLIPLDCFVNIEGKGGSAALSRLCQSVLSRTVYLDRAEFTVGLVTWWLEFRSGEIQKEDEREQTAEKNRFVRITLRLSQNVK